jgi:hypothetical protein
VRDCGPFAQSLLAAIPNRMRDHIEATHRSFLESHVMLQQYSRALAAEDLGYPTPIVVAFGSFGRLDGSSLLSDFDILFLYQGPSNAMLVTRCRELVTNIVKSNRSMLFDHRAAIEDGSFDFDKSPAYPVLSIDEVLETTNETRALQILTEGRVLCGIPEVQSLRATLLSRGGYTENVHEFDLSPMRAALARMKASYCQGVIGRLATEKRPLSNRKVLKLFALREFSYLACLFSLADIAIAVSAGICSAEQAGRTFSAPSVNKLASFANPTGSFGNIIAALPPNVRESLTELVKNKSARLSAEGDALSSFDTGEALFFSELRVLVVSLLSKYDALLRLLHDEQFVALIDRHDASVTNWITLRPFQRIVAYRQGLIDGSKDLAELLSQILDRASLGKPSPALEDAQISLGEIIQYQLELKAVT